MLFKTKLESIKEQIDKVNAKAENLTPEEYEEFKKHVLDIFAQEDPSTEEPTPEEPAPAPVEEDPAPAPEEPVVAFDAEKEHKALKDLVDSLYARVDALEKNVSRYENFGKQENPNYIVPPVDKGKESEELMLKYFGKK